MTGLYGPAAAKRLFPEEGAEEGEKRKDARLAPLGGNPTEEEEELTSPALIAAAAAHPGRLELLQRQWQRCLWETSTRVPTTAPS